MSEWRARAHAKANGVEWRPELNGPEYFTAAQRGVWYQQLALSSPDYLNRGDREILEHLAVVGARINTDEAMPIDYQTHDALCAQWIDELKKLGAK